MSNRLMPADFETEVLTVLQRAAREPGNPRAGLTSYQILDRLPSPIRDRAIAERGAPGTGAGSGYSSASLIQSAAKRLVDGGQARFIGWLDTRGLTFRVAGRQFTASIERVGLWRALD